MKRALCKVAAALMIASLAIAPVSASAAKYKETSDGTTVVYVTKTGEKYHKKGCSSLKKSCIETTLQDAVGDGYEPCKKCKPPTLKK